MKSLAATSRLGRWFDDYASHHQTAGNRLTHQIGVPLIVWSVLGLLSRVQLVDWGWSALLRPDAGLALWFLAGLWYLFLDWKLALPFGLLSLGVYLLGRATPVYPLGFFFILGWGLQLWGHHRYEGRSPAFLSNFRHLLIGPLWLFARWVDYTR